MWLAAGRECRAGTRESSNSSTHLHHNVPLSVTNALDEVICHPLDIGKCSAQLTSLVVTLQGLGTHAAHTTEGSRVFQVYAHAPEVLWQRAGAFCSHHRQLLLGGSEWQQLQLLSVRASAGRCVLSRRQAWLRLV